jgi:hypothetical protein|tara:strand:+ start:56 stop:274 length:219 start_codon:yes stop_codon:yes gene_type:complete
MTTLLQNAEKFAKQIGDVSATFQAVANEYTLIIHQLAYIKSKDPELFNQSELHAHQQMHGPTIVEDVLGIKK